MDENKRQKLKDIGYVIPGTCGQCKHGRFAEMSDGWGECGVHMYQHLKHTDERFLTVHTSGQCAQFERSPRGAGMLGAFTEFVDKKFPPDEGAVFRVIKVDPEGSGTDWVGHLGARITNAVRCCQNCTVIFGKWNDTSDVTFIPGELLALNDKARAIMDEIAPLVARDDLERSKTR